MNYALRRASPATENAVHDITVAELRDRKNVAVVAGHFMLMYDDIAGRLVPMVHQDSQNPRVAAFSRQMAGDFPLRSLHHGVRLMKELRSAEREARIALVVNDHIFLTSGWRSQNLPDSTCALELRRAYYRSSCPIPDSYLAVLRREKTTLDAVLLDNNLATRNRKDTVPRASWLFSEHALRGRFQKETSPTLRAHAGFALRRHGTASELHFRDPMSSSLVCLADDHGCGCSGEIIEFLILLAHRGFDSAVFYLPHECSEASHAGFSAFLHTPLDLRRQLRTIVVVDGFGGVASAAGEANAYMTASYTSA